jgi:hypothetical protein
VSAYNGSMANDPFKVVHAFVAAGVIGLVATPTVSEGRDPCDSPGEVVCRALPPPLADSKEAGERAPLETGVVVSQAPPKPSGDEPRAFEPMMHQNERWLFD